MIYSARGFVKRRMPWVIPPVRKLQEKAYLPIRYIKYSMSIVYYRVRCPKESVFRTIYNNKAWSGSDSASGGGSSLDQTAVLRDSLPNLLADLGARSMLDAPCGDFHWMSMVDLNLKKYIGADIVPELIQDNQKLYGNDRFDFIQADLTKDELPKVDLILCRDCLVHLSFRAIKDCIRNFKKSDSIYLLTTTYPGLPKRNRDIVTGMWRPIDLQLPPFNFPAPIRLVHENNSEKSDYREKSLGLWKVKDLPG